MTLFTFNSTLNKRKWNKQRVNTYNSNKSEANALCMHCTVDHVEFVYCCMFKYSIFMRVQEKKINFLYAELFHVCAQCSRMNTAKKEERVGENRCTRKLSMLHTLYVIVTLFSEWTCPLRYTSMIIVYANTWKFWWRDSCGH